MKKNLLTGLALLAALVVSEQAAAQTQAFALWPMRANNQDSAAVRSAGITVGTPTLKRFVISNGQAPSSSVNATPAYSTKSGQAFAPKVDGSGWGTSASPPGPGGTNSKRLFYEQFTITAAGGAVRADSIILKSSFVLTSSSTTLSVAYSKSNFVSDSTAITGGKGPAGAVGGGFAATNTQPADGPAPIALTQVDGTAGNIFTYRLALADANGVTLTAGQTLTIRMYFSCSSTGIGRYALLKDVLIKSRQPVVTSSRQVGKATSGLVVYPNPAQQNATVAHDAAKAGAKVAVYSATGRLVSTSVPQLGSVATPVDMSTLANGIYLVEYSDAQQRITSKLVKQ